MIIKAVLLDLDGLLVDSEPLHWKAWQKVAEELGATLSEEEISRFTGVGNIVVANFLKEKIETPLNAEDLIKKKVAKYMALLKNIKLMSGIRELLAKIKKNHLRMAVVSGAPRSEAIPSLQYPGIFSYFDVIIAEEDVKNPKPAPDAYLLAAKKLNVLPKECIALEDSETGVASARAAGVYCIAVPNEDSKSQNFSKANLEIESIQAILGENSASIKTKNPMIGKLLG